MEAIKMFEVAAYILVLAGSLSGAVRAASAAFSPRARASIARHPVAHAIWFIIAAVVICDFVVRISASISPRPSPNPASVKAGIASLFAIEHRCPGRPEPSRWTAR